MPINRLWLLLLLACASAACGTTAPPPDGESAGADAGADVPDAEADAAPEWSGSEHCATESCGAGECDAATGTCRCDAGHWFDGYTCTPVCSENCGPPVCPTIHLPTLNPIVATETLVFASATEAGTNVDLDALEPTGWTQGATISLTEFVGSRVRVFARFLPDRGCGEMRVSWVYDVVDSYPAAAGEPGSDAIAADSDQIVGWATEIVTYDRGDEVWDEWADPSRALGPAEGNSSDIVSLGEGGSLTLSFDTPIDDGPGPDFVVFENSFSDTFLEFAFVEVSSDGETFSRFDSASLHDEPVDRFGGTDPGGVGGLPGRYRQGWGTPLDLATLRQTPGVRTGRLDLRRITHVRLVDVVGDGSSLDSFGRPIYDPAPTYESAGFDVDAVGVLNEVTP